MFRYNSYHKIIVAGIILAWAVYHFAGKKEDTYYNNGQIKRVGTQLNSKNEGQWTWYHENGQRSMEGKFRRGKRQGIWLTWDVSGNRITESNYIDDRLNGKYTIWDITGKIKDSVYYKNDVEADWPVVIK